ncbi:hypothetical protein LWX53_04910, partial [bacterium]|nr:hypothetical protein [bacterium]
MRDLSAKVGGSVATRTIIAGAMFFLALALAFPQGNEIGLTKEELASAPGIALAQAGLMTAESFTSSEHIELGYLLYRPEGMSAKGLPLIVYFHGSSLRGSYAEALKAFSLPSYLVRRINLPAIVICPQCPWNRYWGELDVTLSELIKKVMAEYAVNPKKVILTGHSLGGMGTWVIGAKLPELFSCLVPLSGEPYETDLSRLKDIPVWAFAGEREPELEAAEKNAVDALNKL